MKDRWTPLEARLQLRANRIIGKSQQLTREYQREQLARVWTFSQFVSRAFTGMIWLMILGAYPLWLVPQMDAAQGPDGLLAAHSILATLTPVYLASLIWNTLQSSRTVTVFSHLPISDRNLAWQSWRQQIWPLGFVSYGHLCIYLQYLPNTPMNAFLFEGAVLLTGVHVIVYWATALVLLRYLPRFVLGSPAMRYVPVLLLAFCWPQAPLPPRAINFVLMAFPAGWINSMVIFFQQGGTEIWMVFLIPAAGWVGFAAWCTEVVLSRYKIRSFQMRRGEEAAVELVGAPVRVDAALLEEEALSATGLNLEQSAGALAWQRLEQIRSREFVDAEEWSRLGQIEWMVWHCLSPRARMIMETLTYGHINWTGPWLTLVLGSGFAWGMCTLLKLGPIVWYLQWVLSLIYVVSGFWPAFRLRNLGGMYGAQVYGFPLGLDETFATLMKVSLIRILMAVIVWFPMILLIVQQQGQPPQTSIPIVIATFTLSLTLSVWNTFFLFGAGAEFSSGDRKFLWFVCLNFLGLVYIGGIVHTVNSAKIAEFVPRVQAMGMGLSIAMTSTTLNWLLFRTIYRNGALDLVVFQTPYSEKHFAGQELAETQVARRLERRRGKAMQRD